MTEREDGNWVKGFLELPVEHEPGTHFLYNTGASYMLSAIVQELTGMTVLDYLQTRLFVPLGIEGATWGTCPRGISLGGFGLSVKSEDIARFGQLYLQKGMWRGQQILPAAWVEEATARQVPNAPNDNPDWEQGYGYQFWRCRHGAYRGDGAFGQFCIVIPDRDAVLAITSGVGDMQAVLNLVWEHLLPALGPAPLPAGGAAAEELDRKLASLSLCPQQGERSSPLAARVAGREYVFEESEEIQAIAFGWNGDEDVVTLRNGHGESRIACGKGEWVRGTATLDPSGPRRVAASGAWTDEDTYAVQICSYETPFRLTVTCRFLEDRLTLDLETNVSFGPQEHPQRVGRIA
jgi:hypothetical protein